MVASWHQILLDGASLVSLELSEGQTSSLINYLELLIKWNSKVNLVGPGNPEQLLERHLLDSLAVAVHIPSGRGRLVDVGAGAGLPSIPLAIARPDIQVTALEPVRKKSAFLATARRELGLDNFQPVAVRVEHHRASPDFLPYDVAVSRAAFALERWLTLAKGLIAPGGLILGMEGATRVELPPGASRSPYSIQVTARDATRSRAIIAWHPPIESDG